MARRTSRDVCIYAPFASGVLTDPPISGGGGAERQMTLLARALAARGHKVAQLVYPEPTLPRTRDGVEILQRPAPQIGGPAGPLKEARAVWRSLHAADASVYIHRSAGAEVALTATYCRLADRRFIYSSSSNMDFTGEALRGSPRDLFLFRVGLRLAHALIVQTEEQRAMARLRNGSRPLDVIPSFVENARVRVSAEHFLWVGGPRPYKRPELFIDLAEAVPEARFVMVLAIDDEAHRRMMLERAGRLPNLTILWATPHEQIMALIGKAVATVNTSTNEGMPNVFLEGWARGVPALSLQADPDGSIGIADLGVAAHGDWGRFVEGARRLWQDREAAAAAGARGRELTVKRHDPERIVELWTAVIGRECKTAIGKRDGAIVAAP